MTTWYTERDGQLPGTPPTPRPEQQDQLKVRPAAGSAQDPCPVPKRAKTSNKISPRPPPPPGQVLAAAAAATATSPRATRSAEELIKGIRDQLKGSPPPPQGHWQQEHSQPHCQRRWQPPPIPRHPDFAAAPAAAAPQQQRWQPPPIPRHSQQWQQWQPNSAAASTAPAVSAPQQRLPPPPPPQLPPPVPRMPTVSQMTPTVTPTGTPRYIAPEIRERVEGYKESALRGQGLKRKGDAGKPSTSRQVKGKRDDGPQWAWDLVAVFLQSWHIAFKPYGLRTCKIAHNSPSNEPPRALRESQKFIQNNIAEAMEKIQRTAEAAGTRWELADGWLDVGVVRAVADQFLCPFVWHWDAPSPPPSVWRWDGVWIYEYEKETILAVCMRNFLSVNQEEIRSAAESYRTVGQGEEEWC